MITIFKPDLLKTKEEMLEDAKAKAAEAHVAAKEAIKAAKEAKAEVKVIRETPEELLDAVLAPKPGTDEAKALEESMQTGVGSADSSESSESNGAEQTA